MKIAIWDSESESTLNFVQTAEVFADVLLYDEVEDLFDALGEQVDLIVFDYDSDKKTIDKFIKKFRKDGDEVKILILSNVLNPKQLVKHQSSKSGADIYLRTPVTLDLLKSIFEPFFDIEIDGDSSGVVPPAPSLSKEDKSIQSKIISDHQMDSEINEEAKAISDNIQNKFNIIFPPEEDKAALALEEIAKQEEREALEAKNNVEIEDISLDDDLDETEDALDLGDESDALELSTDDDALELGGDDEDTLELSADEEEDEIKVPDEDDLTYPDLSTDMLTEESEKIENDKEPDMSGHDETDLEMDDLETLELGEDEEGLTAEVDDGALELAVDDTEGLDLSTGDDEETIAEVDDGAMDLDIGDDIGLDLSSADDEETIAVVDDGAMDLAIDDTDALDLSADGDALESVDIVTDELDLDAPAVEEAPAESNDSLELGADEEDSLELGGDDESFDLGGDDDSLDLGGDDDSLDLGADDEDSLELGGDDESLELGGDDDLGESLDLGTDDDSLDFSEDEIEFGVNGDNIDEVVEEASLSANDLPAAPDGIEDLAFGSGEEVSDQDLSFDSEESGDHTDDVMAKLAEIDAMMDDGPVQTAAEEATGEHEIPAELHAQAQMDEIDEMTEIMPVQTLTDDAVMEEEALPDDEALDDLTFGSGEETEVAKAPPVQPIAEAPVTPVAVPPAGSVADHNAYMQHHGEELTRYGETIKNLREEREDLLFQITKVEDKNEILRRDQLDMKSELDEKKIELSIVKKRHEKQVDELKYHLDISNDRREVLEEKNKQFEKEYEHLNRKIKVDLNKVRSRERDLENKLEMLRADAELQIRNRDQKILELKRKIDTLQFDVESIQVQERKVASNSHQLEDKMQKVIRTLRRAIGDLEEDGSSIRSIEEIKKNLDV